MTDVISGVIDQRIEGTCDRHQHTEDQSEEYGEKDHPESIILCLFDLAASQYLTDKNADSFSHCNKSDHHYVVYRSFDLYCRNGVKAPV